MDIFRTLRGPTYTAAARLITLYHASWSVLYLVVFLAGLPRVQSFIDISPPLSTSISKFRLRRFRMPLCFLLQPICSNYNHPALVVNRKNHPKQTFLWTGMSGFVSFQNNVLKEKFLKFQVQRFLFCTGY